MPPSFWTHFGHLLGRSWQATTSAMGTTTLAVVVTLALVVLSFALTHFDTHEPFYGFGPKRLKQPWKVVAAVATPAVAWAGLVAYFAVVTIVQDHHQLMIQNDTLASRLSGLETKAAGTTACEGEVRQLKEQVAALKKKPAVVPAAVACEADSINVNGLQK